MWEEVWGCLDMWGSVLEGGGRCGEKCAGMEKCVGMWGEVRRDVRRGVGGGVGKCGEVCWGEGRCGER